MSVFDVEYASAYDLLYKDKNYGLESAFVHSLVQRHMPVARSLLDLGAGTGRHDVEFCRLGYEVSGVERSVEMLQTARGSAAAMRRVSPDLTLPTFSQGDIRSVRLGRTFDLATSLFHVMGYLGSNEDLRAGFETAKQHVRQGGLFIFDFWYGPAVLTERPAVRVKRLEDGSIDVTRIAEPVLKTAENMVEVHYEMFVRRKADNHLQLIRERHDMRYFSLPEIRWIAEQAGWQLLEFGEWMTGAEPTENSWSVYCVLKNDDSR
jgi:SAM-dependent methyltransferase